MLKSQWQSVRESEKYKERERERREKEKLKNGLKFRQSEGLMSFRNLEDEDDQIDLLDYVNRKD